MLLYFREMHDPTWISLFINPLYFARKGLYKNVKELSSGLLGFQLSQKKIKVVLKFTMFAGTHLYESPLSENQKISKTKDGFLVVKDELIDDMELRFWIRGFGDQVEVMKPEKLRKEFIAMISRMGKKYE